MLTTFPERFFRKAKQTPEWDSQLYVMQSIGHYLLQHSSSVHYSFIIAEIWSCETVPAGMAQAISCSNRCLKDEITEGPDGPNPFSRCLAVVHY